MTDWNSNYSDRATGGDDKVSTDQIDLAVVLPTFNERGNIAELISRLGVVLDSLNWELIFVDDDSTDGTSALIESYARADRRIRLLRRIGRRGLSSACIEGIMATSAPYVAVMDADLQHDETLLPAMYTELHRSRLDVVIGTRNASGGSMGDFSARRVLLSRAGKAVSRMVCHRELTDPMSGFFMVDRRFFLQAVRKMQGSGFKILLDLLASSPQTVRVGELGYCFRQRRHGRSKLDLNTGIEYLSLIANKWTGGLLPSRFALFALVGAAGLCTHLLCLAALMAGLHVSFLPAQAIATFVAMTENFYLNNLITFRDLRLRGLSLLLGLVSFCLACSFGAMVNLVLARSLSRSGCPLYLAGAAGIIVSSVWNYSVSSLFTWQRRPWPEEDEQLAPTSPSPELNSLAGERPKPS